MNVSLVRDLILKSAILRLTGLGAIIDGEAVADGGTGAQFMYFRLFLLTCLVVQKKSGAKWARNPY